MASAKQHAVLGSFPLQPIQNTLPLYQRTTENEMQTTHSSDQER